MAGCTPGRPRSVLQRTAGHIEHAAAATPTPAPRWAFGDDLFEERDNGGVLAPRPIVDGVDCPASGAPDAALTPAEAAHFRAHGWVLRRKLIPPEQLEPFVERLWAIAPPRVQRGDPASWVDASERWDNSPPGYHGTMLQYFGADSRSGASRASGGGQWWLGDIGTDPAFLHATSRHPRALRMVESLLGANLKLPSRLRGIYTVWPQSQPAYSLGPHVDSQSEELLTTTYLGTVTEHDAPFTIWPGTHAPMWAASTEQNNWRPDETPGPDGQTKFDSARSWARAEVQPLSFTGEIGDTLFWHARLLHCTGVHTGGNVRIAAIQDYRRAWPCSRCVRPAV
jgi:hypothetical protein